MIDYESFRAAHPRKIIQRLQVDQVLERVNTSGSHYLPKGHTTVGFEHKKSWILVRWDV